MKPASVPDSLASPTGRNVPVSREPAADALEAYWDNNVSANLGSNVALRQTASLDGDGDCPILLKCCSARFTPDE